MRRALPAGAAFRSLVRPGCVPLTKSFAFACSACAPTAFGRPIWPVGPRFGSLGPFRGRFSRVLSVDFHQILRSFCRSSFRSFFRCILEVVCSPHHLCTWIGRTSPNPDFVRPVEVFQGFFDIVHPCWHHESIVERSTIIQKLFDKINRIFIETSNKNRRKIGSVSIPDEKRVRTRLEDSPRRPGSAPVQPNSASGASRECPQSALERPESVQERSRGVPEPPRNAPDRPRCAPD